MAENAQKVVTLGTLGAVIDKIQQDYPTRTEVTEEIQQTGGAAVEYATEEEVLALFATESAESGEEGTV